MEEDDHPRGQPRYRGQSPRRLTYKVRMCADVPSGVIFSHRMTVGGMGCVGVLR